MPHAHGYRARTRHMFSLGFRQGGVINLSTYLKPVKVGDLVDIVANPAIHKGMPHKYYHGRTGTVFNVTPHAVGVEVNKAVRTRVVRKRLHVRIEHVRQSKCRKDFLDRVLRNDAIKRAAKEAGSTFLFVVLALIVCAFDLPWRVRAQSVPPTLPSSVSQESPHEASS